MNLDLICCLTCRLLLAVSSCLNVHNAHKFAQSNWFEGCRKRAEKKWDCVIPHPRSISAGRCPWMNAFCADFRRKLTYIWNGLKAGNTIIELTVEPPKSNTSVGSIKYSFDTEVPPDCLRHINTVPKRQFTWVFKTYYKRPVNSTYDVIVCSKTITRRSAIWCHICRRTWCNICTRLFSDFF